MDSKLIRNWIVIMILVVVIICSSVIFLNWNKQNQTGTDGTKQTVPVQTTQNGTEENADVDYREFLNDPFFFDED